MKYILILLLFPFALIAQPVPRVFNVQVGGGGGSVANAATKADIAALALPVNVLLNGVQQDGTDQSAEVQALLQSNTSFFFPKGTYYYTTYFAINNLHGVKLIGEPGTVFTTTDNNIFGIIGSSRDIEVSGIKFVSTMVSNTNIPYGLINIIANGGTDTIRNVNIHDCEFTNPLVNCNAIKWISEGEYSMIDGLYINRNWGKGIGRFFAEGQNHVSPKRVRFKNFEVNSNRVEDVGTIQDNDVKGAISVSGFSTNGKINDNTILDLLMNTSPVQYYAIENAGTEGLETNNNHIESTRFGFTGIIGANDPLSGWQIKDNFIYVRGSNADNGRKNGIDVHSITNLLVEGNTVIADGFGATFSDCHKSKITNNTFISYNLPGMYFQNGCTDNDINNNTVDLTGANSNESAIVFTGATTTYNSLGINRLYNYQGNEGAVVQVNGAANNNAATVAGVVSQTLDSAEVTGANKLAFFGDSQAAGLITKAITESPYELFEGGYSGQPPSYILARMREHPETYSWNQIIWMGQNKESNTSILPYARIDSAVALLGDNKRFLIISLMTGAGGNTVTEEYNRVITINDSLAKEYTVNYFDARTYMIQHGLQEAGITATPQDEIDISNNTVPTSLRLDDIHLNSTGNLVLIRRLLKQLDSVNNYFQKFVPISTLVPTMKEIFGLSYNTRDPGNNYASGGLRIAPTLKATANNQVLVATEINPLFNDNGKTGVRHIAMNINGELNFPEIFKASIGYSSINSIFISEDQASFATPSSSGYMTWNIGPTIQYLITAEAGGEFIVQTGNPSLSSGSRFTVSSSTKGSLPAPRMNEAQRNAISTPAPFLMTANTTTGKYNFYNGTSWVSLLDESGFTASGDIEITDATKGYILRSPNGTRFRITITDAGSLVTTQL